MVKNRYFLKYCLIGTIILTMVVFNTPKARGEEENLTRMTLPDADTFVYGMFDENETLLEGDWGGGDYEQQGDHLRFNIGYYFIDFGHRYKYQPYLRFNLPNETSEIVSITLKLWQDWASSDNVEYNNYNINVSLVGNNWDEYDINWTHRRPEYLGASINITIDGANIRDEYKYLNLTYFKDYIENNTLSISIIPSKFMLDSVWREFYIGFTTKEESEIGKRPYLYIEYNESYSRPEPIPLIEPEPEHRNGYTFMQDSNIAIDDTYVSWFYKTFNGGSLPMAYCGFRTNINNDMEEAYFRFDITNRPENWTKVEIKLYSEKYPYHGYFDLNVYLVNESWNEMTMTWNNKPKKGIFMQSLNFYYEDDHGLYFLINISDYIDDYINNNETTISIGINGSLYQMEDNYAKIYSTEYTSNYLRPRLVWSYYVTDVTPPYIQIIPPQDNQLFGKNAPIFTINQLIDDSTIDSMWYTINNGLTNHSFTQFTETVNQTDWDNQQDGEITIRVYAEDMRGNIGYGTRRVRKDTTAPIIIINAPVTNEKFGDNPPELNITVIDDNLDSIWFQLIGETYTSENLTWTGTIAQDIWDMFRNEKIIIRIYADDELGYIGYNSVTVEKSVYRYAEPDSLITISIIIGSSGCGIGLIIALRYYLKMKKLKRQK